MPAFNLLLPYPFSQGSPSPPNCSRTEIAGSSVTPPFPSSTGSRVDSILHTLCSVHFSSCSLYFHADVKSPCGFLVHLPTYVLSFFHPVLKPAVLALSQTQIIQFHFPFIGGIEPVKSYQNLPEDTKPSAFS